MSCVIRYAKFLQNLVAGITIEQGAVRQAHKVRVDDGGSRVFDQDSLEESARGDRDVQ